MEGVHQSGHTLRAALVRRHRQERKSTVVTVGKGSIRVNGRDRKDKPGPQRFKRLHPL